MSHTRVDAYVPGQWEAVAGLLRRDPFKPLAGHSQWPPEDLAALALARAANTLASTHTTAWIARESDAVEGCAALSALPWDSQQLGLSAARVDYLVAGGDYARQYGTKQELLQVLLKRAQMLGVQHLSARVDASDRSGIHALERAGFVTVDGLLTFALDLGQQVAPDAAHAGVRIRLAGPDDAPAAAELARHAYIYDRFHSDPAIPPERADELHAVWLYNSCRRIAADAVILAEDAEGLQGFVTCKLQSDTPRYLKKLIGTIVLVATAERGRGRGIAQRTTRAALAWFRQQGAAIVDVGTQLRNIPASRLYATLDFRLVGSSISLRKIL